MKHVSNSFGASDRFCHAGHRAWWFLLGGGEHSRQGRLDKLEPDANANAGSGSALVPAQPVLLASGPHSPSAARLVYERSRTPFTKRRFCVRLKRANGEQIEAAKPYWTD